MIDAGLIGNLARFANHSCDPNMVMQKWNVLGEWRVGLFALKPVAAGEEMTWNYDLESFEGHANMKCNCGALNCSGFLGVKPEIRAPEQKPKAAARTSSPKQGAKKRKKKPQDELHWMRGPGVIAPTYLAPLEPRVPRISLSDDSALALRRLARQGGMRGTQGEVPSELSSRHAERVERVLRHLARASGVDVEQPKRKAKRGGAKAEDQDECSSEGQGARPGLACARLRPVVSQPLQWPALQCCYEQ